MKFSWRLFWILMAAAIFGIVAAIPAGYDLFASVIAAAEPPPLPIPVVIILGAIQNLILLALFVGVGLRLSAKLDLGPEVTHAWLEGKPVSPRLLKSLSAGLVGGVLVGAVLVPLILVLASRLPGLPFVAAAKIAIWKRFLMCFYGGFYEEVFARLFLLSLFAWLIGRHWRSADKKLSNKVFWSANIIVALIFGLGHLPSAGLVMTITPLVVFAALVLNGIAALVFGYLYRLRGLESAVIAHFIADILIWVIGPLFL